ncbi:hypothetical protein D3C80_1693230 [compost metagenome]
MDLPDHDLARARDLVHRQGGVKQVVGVRVEPVFQRAVAVGFTQLGTGVDRVFSARAGHR